MHQIPPDSDVAMVQLAVVNESGGAVGQLFLIYAAAETYDFTEDRV